MKAQIVYLNMYNFIEDFIKIIAYCSQLLVFIGDTIIALETLPSSLVLLAGRRSKTTYRSTGENQIFTCAFFHKHKNSKDNEAEWGIDVILDKGEVGKGNS